MDHKELVNSFEISVGILIFLIRETQQMQPSSTLLSKCNVVLGVFQKSILGPSLLIYPLTIFLSVFKIVMFSCLSFLAL